MAHLVPALLLSSLAACAGSAPGDGSADTTGDSGAAASACEAGDPSVELGTGEVAYEPLSDGDPVEVINGPQGGQHILASVRTSGMTSIATVHLTIQRAQDESYVSDQTYRLQFFEDPDRGSACAWLYPGLYGYLGFVSVAEDDADFLWKDAIMRVEVTDEAGQTASDSVVVVPELGPAAPGGDPAGDPPEEPTEEPTDPPE